MAKFDEVLYQDLKGAGVTDAKIADQMDMSVSGMRKAAKLLTVVIDGTGNKSLQKIQGKRDELQIALDVLQELADSLDVDALTNEQKYDYFKAMHNYNTRMYAEMYKVNKQS